MKLKMMLLIIATLGLGACAKKKSDNIRSNRMNALSAAPTNPGTGSTTCPTNYWGRVFSNGMTTEMYTQTIQAFTGDSQVGYVDPNYNSSTTGVDIQFSADFRGGSFVAANSRLLLRIFDSNYQTLGVIEVPMNGQSGQVLGTGTFQAVYQDSAGTVTLRGQRQADASVRGEIWFQNTSGAQGSLGEFIMNGCALAGI
ncbi:MAG: hypothetical protein ACK5V3_11500 [Bdellovibrionales bacterium]